HRDLPPTSQACPGLPVVHDLSPDLSEVHHLQSYCIRVLEERRVVVWSLLRVVARLRGLDPRLPHLPRRAVHGCLVHHPEAEVVQPGRVRVVPGGALSGWPQRVGELAVVVEEVRIAAYGALALAEAQDSHDAIVELLRTSEIHHRHEDVVHANHFHRHVVSPSSETLNGTSVAADEPFTSRNPSSVLVFRGPPSVDDGGWGLSTPGQADPRRSPTPRAPCRRRGDPPGRSGPPDRSRWVSTGHGRAPGRERRMPRSAA